MGAASLPSEVFTECVWLVATMTVTTSALARADTTIVRVRRSNPMTNLSMKHLDGLGLITAAGRDKAVELLVGLLLVGGGSRSIQALGP
jgi:hypothetical protein